MLQVEVTDILLVSTTTVYRKCPVFNLLNGKFKKKQTSNKYSF